VKPNLCDKFSPVEVVKERAMARDAGKAVADLARDRQGGQADDENHFNNRQEGMAPVDLEGVPTDSTVVVAREREKGDIFRPEIC
jgi:hypothetical protein